MTNATIAVSNGVNTEALIGARGAFEQAPLTYEAQPLSLMKTIRVFSYIPSDLSSATTAPTLSSSADTIAA